MAIKRLKKPFEGYGIDSEGNVWSFKGETKTKVKPREDKDGYLRVNLADQGASKNGFKEVYIHKLVAQAFLSGSAGKEIHHKDGNKRNNKTSNLEFATKSENAKAREAAKREDAIAVDEWMEDRLDSFYDKPQWEITPEGYLHAGKVVLAVEGSLDYTAEGGTKEWVSVSALDSLVATIRGKPVTKEHPVQKEVNARTAKILSLGTVLNAWVDAYDKDPDKMAAYGEVVIHDEDLVREILRGTNEVSPGYDATLSIVPPGQEDEFGGATLIQTSRHANHLAVTKAGRGGPDVSIRLDAANNEDEMEEKDKDLQAKYDAMKKELDALKAKNDALQAKNDAFEDMLKKKKEDEEMEDEKKNDSLIESRMVSYFNERQEALSLAKRLRVNVNDSATNHEIRKACVLAALGDKFKRTDSVEAVQAAFEAVSVTAPRNQAEDLAQVLRHNDSVAPNGGLSFISDFYSKRG